MTNFNYQEFAPFLNIELMVDKPILDRVKKVIDDTVPDVIGFFIGTNYEELGPYYSVILPVDSNHVSLHDHVVQIPLGLTAIEKLLDLKLDVDATKPMN